MSSQPSRGGTSSGGGSTMTWASSRRLVITNDVPQIVVGGGGTSSTRAHDRSGAAVSFAAQTYTPRGTSSSQVSSRGGFQPSRGNASGTTYTARNVAASQRGGSCYAWRGGSTPTPTRGNSVAVTTYYRGAGVNQTRPTLFTRSNVTSTMQLPTSPRPTTPDPNVPKFYPMAQTALAPAAQFPDTLPPSAAIAYPFQVRRMAALIQPVIARRDVRFTTPTAIAISKKTPIGVTLPCGDVAEENTRPPEVANKTSGTQGGAGDQNRCDSDGDEEDGRTSPDVLSTSMRSNEDTWDFWDRVYSDPELRQSMQERQRDSPMAELLHSDKLCKAQVVFLNVPRLAYGQQHVVRSLIHREINSNLPILDIHITYRKWTIRFYRSEDAVQVLKHFNGFSFRNHKLLVRACQNNTGLGDAATLEEAAQQESEERRAGPGTALDGVQRLEHDSLWTLTEWKDISDFKKDLVAILEGKQTGMVMSEALAEASAAQRRGFIAAAAELWPTGLIRIMLPEVKAIGRCVCLAGHEDMATLVRRAAQEGTPRLMTDSWEPIPPCEIRTEQHLLSYLAAFLAHFGPQNTIIDIPLRLLLKSLSGNWPTTGPALAEWATKRSYQFIVMFEVLYLASSIRHRRILVEAVQPLSSLKFKFMNAANRC